VSTQTLRSLRLRRLRRLILLVLAFRAAIHRKWLKGLLETTICGLACFRLLPYRRELLLTPQGCEYSVWWPRCAPVSPKRCWVLLPGGMSNGHDFYITSLGTSSAIAPDEAWVVFHNPGQGGSHIKTLENLQYGLTRTDCLTDFLSRIRSKFSSIVVVGFSAGGMCVTALAQQVSPIADAFVTVCTPDRIRLVFEAHSRWWFRFDVFFAIWFHLCVKAAGIEGLVRFGKFPWPPTWHGYMRPFTEHVFKAVTGSHRRFEELEGEHFDGSLKAPSTMPCLRIWCRDDPIVPASSLENGRFQHSEVWWEESGGHCGQFFWSGECVRRLRAWAVRVSPVLN